jgi:2-polyprenyl-6-methoxyphenol hydroxylase-like FAD-dependent oxidoreductase
MAAGLALAEEAASGPTLEAALARYEARWRKPVARRQAAGRRIAKWFVPSSRLRLAIRNVGLRAIQWRGFDSAMRAMFVSGMAREDDARAAQRESSPILIRVSLT